VLPDPPSEKIRHAGAPVRRSGLPGCRELMGTLAERRFPGVCRRVFFPASPAWGGFKPGEVDFLRFAEEFIRG